MRFIRIFGIALMIWATTGLPAQASSDYFHQRTWAWNGQQLSPGNNLAMLQPGNDTRVNLLLLLQDKRRASATAGEGRVFFEWPELTNSLYPAPADSESNGRYSHSRCQTVDTGRDAFVQAVRAVKNMPEMEGDLLIAVRRSLSPDCEDPTSRAGGVTRLTALKSRAARDFGIYLTSALAFYNGDFDTATKGFSSLVQAKNDWLKETSLYMIARSELNRSQVRAFGDYGYFEGPSAVDQGAIRNAERGFNLYRKIYPEGSYQQSAKGLLRRVYWLAGDTRKLSAEYGEVLSRPSATGLQLPVLIQEVDDKLLPNLSPGSIENDPELLAMSALYRMRKPYDPYGEKKPKPAISRSEIEAMRDSLESRPGLFEYLLAAHAFYVANNPKFVVETIRDDARRPNYGYLDFSRQVLRGRALEAVGDRNARGFWQQLLSGAESGYQRGLVEFALARNLERSDLVADVFAADSVIQTPVLREILLQYSAGPALLRRQAKDAVAVKRERDLALYVLLYRELTHRDYSAFLDDLKLVPADAKLAEPFYNLSTENNYGYEVEPRPVSLGLFTKFNETTAFGCPRLKQTVQTLASSPNDPRAQLCLGDYLRMAGFDDYWLDEQPEADSLGGQKQGFPGSKFSRLEAYKRIIADPSSSRENRAYALYRAVWCYGPAGKNSCGGEEVGQGQRAAWFRELKTRYPSSQWAQKLKFYW